MHTTDPSPRAEFLFKASAILAVVLGMAGFLVFSRSPVSQELTYVWEAEDGGAYPVSINGQQVGTTPLSLDRADLLRLTDPALVPPDWRSQWPPPPPAGYSGSGGDERCPGTQDQYYLPSPDSDAPGPIFLYVRMLAPTDQCAAFTYRVVGPDGGDLQLTSLLGEHVSGGPRTRENTVRLVFSRP